MKLIKINDKVLVNPEKIISVEDRGSRIVVKVEGSTYEITNRKDMDDFIIEFMGANSNLWGAQHFKG